MNVYATNNTDGGHEFAGSFESLTQAMAWATARGMTFAHWWADGYDDEEEMPDWARFPSD